MSVPTLVQLTLTDDGGHPVGRRTVSIELGGDTGHGWVPIPAWSADGKSALIRAYTVQSDINGVVGSDTDGDGNTGVLLAPNSTLSPAGTSYRVTLPGNIVEYGVVPTGGPVQWHDCLTTDPPQVTAPTVALLDNGDGTWTLGGRVDVDTVAQVAALIAAEKTRAENVEAVKADLVGGVVPTSQIPLVAITSFSTVADEAAMLALTGVQPGDFVVRLDTSTVWILTADDPSVIGSWLKLSMPAAAVTSINNQTGAVVLGASDVGAVSASAAYQPSASATGVAYGDSASASASGTLLAPSWAFDIPQGAPGDPGTLETDDVTSDSGAVTLTYDGTHAVLPRKVTGDVTYSVATPDPDTSDVLLTVPIGQDATGGHAVAWDDTILWPSGVVPSLPTSAGSLSLVTLLRCTNPADGSRVWTGFVSGAAMAVAS